MITLQTDKELLIQIHKNQISTPLQSTCLIRLTNSISNNKSIEVTATVENLSNCYILTITEAVNSIGSNALLEIFDNTKLAFRSETFITESI